MRDDFLKTTREKLAHRAGYRCSKPDCQMPTRGAASDEEKTIDVGFAAHITAAAPGGPRYDPSLTSEQRRNHKNGIWLCGTHAKLVDSDESHFTVEELQRWKSAAEKRSFSDVVHSKSDSIKAQRIDDQNLQKTVTQFLELSILDLDTFKNLPGWSPHAIPLNLKIIDESETRRFNVYGLANAIDTFNEIALIAPPGTGKTTTLIQLADAVLTKKSNVAVFLPLSEWSTGSDSLIQSLMKRAAFNEANLEQFHLLAQHGRMVLMLDGWNELDVISKQRLRSDIKLIRRDYPNIRIVISSRSKEIDLPIDGPVVKVGALTEEQQFELAVALDGQNGKKLIDHALRTSGLRELVGIPLFLMALLKNTAGGTLPTTKEEVLRFFVDELERDPDKSSNLRETLQNYHRKFLEALAVEGTRQATTALSEANAREQVNKVQTRLKESSQIAELIQPMHILDALVDSHMLVKSGADLNSVSFQHQQFQEWFASFWVEHLMLASASGDISSNQLLRKEILNIPMWEEEIIFACERLSRSDEKGAVAVEQTILQTLKIDPLLAAEMIYRSSDHVWEQISAKVLTFATNWHRVGIVDRAINFMIDSGRPEFSEYIWPLISNPDNQVHLSALRAGTWFRSSVLGPNIQDRIAQLSVEVRSHIISEIARNGGIGGMEYASILAMTDENLQVKINVIDSLLFRKAEHCAKQILESAPDEVWTAVARQWYPDEIEDPSISSRIKTERDRIFAEEKDPYATLFMHLHIADTQSVQSSVIQESVRELDFSGDKQSSRSLIQRAYELYPHDVVAGLILRLENGKDVPYGSDDWLRNSQNIVDEGQLANRVVNNSGDPVINQKIVSIVGPDTIDQLITQLSDINSRILTNIRYNKELSDEYYRLLSWISLSKPDLFIQVVLARANTEDPIEIGLLADLISRHGRNSDREPLVLNPENHALITSVVCKWAEILLISDCATRAQFANIAQVAERLKSSSLVPVLSQLLEQEILRRRRSIEELVRSRSSGESYNGDASMSWTLQYRHAFAAIAGEQVEQLMISYLPCSDFGIDAAQVLKSVWKKTQPSETDSGFVKSWPDFSSVADIFNKRQSGTEIETHQFVDDLLSVVTTLSQPDATEAEIKHALALANIAFSMPYSGKSETIEHLTNLSAPAIDKRDLLTTFALSGEIISSVLVLSGIDELLEKSKPHLWMLQDQEAWRLNAWLRLLPFTDNPRAVLDILDRLNNLNLRPHNLRELVAALGYGPSEECEGVLRELAVKDAHFLNEYDWCSALFNRNTLTAANIFLDLLCTLQINNNRGSHSSFELGNYLASYMSREEAFRQVVYEQFERIASGPAKKIIEFAIAEVADNQGVLVLLHNSAKVGKSFSATSLRQALQNALVDRMPIDGSGTNELVSLPAAELRKELCNIMVCEDSVLSQLAKECLSTIDEIRDDYGHVDTEPRHPNIEIDVAWPLIEN